MAKSSDTTAVARSYAQALLELAEARGQLDSASTDMQGVAEVFEANEVFRQYAKSPAVSQMAREVVLDKAFGGQISPLVLNFLKLVNSKDRLNLMPAIAEAFENLLDEKHGKIEVDVTVAQALTPDELERVRQRVGRSLKKDAVIHQYVDESIIGGLIIRVADQLIDGSVRAQLDAMKKKLLASG